MSYINDDYETTKKSVFESVPEEYHNNIEKLDYNDIRSISKYVSENLQNNNSYKIEEASFYRGEGMHKQYDTFSVKDNSNLGGMTFFLSHNYYDEE